MKILIAVFVGGGFGSVLRYIFQLFIPSNTFPWATLTANLLSCLIVGFILSQPSKIKDFQFYKTFIITGFCGGLSTFSGIIREEYQFINIQEYLLALGYCVLSFTLGIISILGGLWLGKQN